jgi:hypothetical protein
MQPTLADCRHPGHARVAPSPAPPRDPLSGNLSRDWADSPYIPKIVCWQGTAFATGFQAYGPSQKWIGVFAMTKREVQTIAGPWLSNDRNELIPDADGFAHGWDVCRHRAENTRTVRS